MSFSDASWRILGTVFGARDLRKIRPKSTSFFDGFWYGFCVHFERVPGLLLGGFRAPKTMRNPFKFSLLFSSLPGFVSGGPSDRFGATFRRFLEPRSKRPDPCFDWPLPVRSRVRASAGASEGRARTNRKRHRILREFSTNSGLVLGRSRTPFWLPVRVRIP